jgi:hypothetical protein
MNDWQAFLAGRGAHLNQGVVEDFGDPAGERRSAEEQALIAPLSHLGVAAIEGPDAPDVLQGQQTNDIRDVTPEHTQLAGICSNKGRLLATYRVVRRGQALCLVLPRSQVSAVVGRLRQFILRAKATVRDASQDLLALGLQGEAAAERARSVLGALPAQVDEAVHAGEHTIVRLPGRPARYLLLVPPGAAPGTWDALATACRPVGRAAWELTEIRAGLPTVQPETADAFVPQMVNYSLLGGVSFTKGCYTGQEVIARTQYLGRLKRRMHRAWVRVGERPPAGLDLYSPRDPSGQSVGRVVSAEVSPEGGYELLAVIQNDAAAGPVHLGAADGPTLTLLDLPYAVPEE